jgi:SAM-dependent methyltransferase
MASLPASTSAQTAEAAGLDERYVREWLAATTQAHPDVVLSNIARLLRPGGHYLCVDIAASSDLAGNLDHPLGPFGYTISCMHCVTVSLAAGGIGLGAMWGEQRARQMLAQAGFTSVEIKRVDGDIFNNYYVATNA